MSYEPVGANLFNPFSWFSSGGSANASVVYVAGGTWVDQVVKTIVELKRRRGGRPGVRVTLPTGRVAQQTQVPLLTCGDVAAAFDGWAGELIDKTAIKAINPMMTVILGPLLSLEFNPYAKELQRLREAMESDCSSPAQLYPHIDLFIALVKRLAIELDSRKAVPSGWQLVVESFSESWDDFKRDTGKSVASAATWSMSKLLWPAAMGAVIYFGIVKRD